MLFWRASGIAAWRWTLLNGLWSPFECVRTHHQECSRVCRADSRSFDAYQIRRNCQVLFRMPHTPRRQRAVLSYEVVCLSCSLHAAISKSHKRQHSARQKYAAYAETVNHCLSCNLHQPQFQFYKGQNYVQYEI